MCAWSLRRWKREEMIWVIMVNVCNIISEACIYALLRIRSSNDGALYRGPETTLYRMCSSLLYGIVSNETWAVIVPQEYYFPSTCCHVILKILLTLFTILVSVCHKIMRGWRWHEPGEGSESDELADVQSMDEMALYSYSSTVFTNMVTVLCHLTIILYMDMENLSPPCLATFWDLSVIGIILIVIPMLYKLQFQSRMYHPWSSKSSTCGDDAGREAVFQERFGFIMYFLKITG